MLTRPVTSAVSLLFINLKGIDKQTCVTIIMVTMPKQKRFTLVYPPIIKQHLKSIEAKYYSLIRESIEAQLQFEPDVETRNRKPLKRPVVFGAKWEIRFGADSRLRVFYRVDYDQRQVVILAIGEKVGNRLLIGGQEIKL